MNTFNPSKRERLSQETQTEIAQLMQFLLLDGIFHNKKWETKDLVFHGGTSIHIAWASPRHSEDLDFLLNVEKANEIEHTINETAEQIRHKIKNTYPGSEIEIKTKGQPDELRTVLAYDIIWKHPKKQGKIRVKTEFFIIPPENIKNYQAFNAKWDKNDMFVWLKPNIPMPHNIISHDRNQIHNAENSQLLGFETLEAHDVEINVATPSSIYGDKLKCMSTRPYIKPRDYFDLWWINTQIPEAVPKTEDELYKIIRTSADCYETTDEELIEGMQRNLELDRQETINQIAENLKTFLPLDIYNEMEEKNCFSEIFDHAMDEMERSMKAIEHHLYHNNSFKC